MRILIYIHSLSSGGAERVTSLLANHWKEKDWEIVIVTDAGSELDFYALNVKVKRIALNLNKSSRNILYAIYNNICRIFALRAVLKDLKPDIAIAMMTAGSCILAWAGKGTGIPLIGSERTYPPMWPLGKIWDLIRRWSYPRLDAMVAQTVLSAKWLSEHAPAKKITVIPNPTIYPLIKHKPNILVNSIIPNVEDRHILLAVGRLEREKGFDRLLDAFAGISREFPRWVLVILGDGSQRSALVQQAIDNELLGKVYLPGTAGNVGDWLDAADLFVLTSRFEGFPNTLLEALAYGLPAVAVDCKTGPRDILHHEVNGLLVPQDDKSSLVETLRRIMSDENLRKQYAENAVEVRHRYSLENISKMWEQLFIEVNSG